MSLAERLKAQIAASGPLTVAQYMTACLLDPEGGYYATRPRLGAGGDFITAPMVSQMFGELIGLWAVETWTRMGRPARFGLIEVGPGDGTLMSDLLRAARVEPDFLAAAELWLVDPSEPLRRRQAARLADAPLRPRWAGSLDEIGAGAPVILVANEVLDCLPARQFVRTAAGWAEQVVGLTRDGGLGFGLAVVPPLGGEAPEGAILEVSAAQAAFGAAVGGLAGRDGGAALLIDYGRAEPGFGDTLQALKDHRKVDPLACPGEADLTVHADFPSVLAGARSGGAQTTKVLTQGEFLRRLGIEQRCAALARSRPDQAEILQRQLYRLTGADQMGELFKVAAVHSPGLSVPAFEEFQT